MYSFKMLSANKFLQSAMYAAIASASVAPSLFVTSYAGNITTLSVTQTEGTYHLTPLSANTGCGPNPSWLTIDTESKVLYCLDEGLEVPNGSLSSYSINADGSLRQVQKASVISGPVSGAIYNNRSSLALAHYSGSAVSTWKLSPGDSGHFSLDQDITFKLDHPGPNPERQDKPHEHEAIVDPTGQYVLVPDLGADLVRVFGFNSSGSLVAKTPLSVVPGSGPRHGAFYLPDGKSGCTTYLYIVTELGNTVTGYSVTYLPNKGGLEFKEVYTSGTYGDMPVPAGNAAAEVAVSPDNRFLVISNRNATVFQVANPDPKNSTKIPSDAISTFALNKDGTLKFTQLAAAGGSYPRQFAINAAGDLVAVGLQMSSAVTLLKRDVKSGLIGDIAARIPLTGQITCVRWNEKTFDGTYADV